MLRKPRWATLASCCPLSSQSLRILVASQTLLPVTTVESCSMETFTEQRFLVPGDTNFLTERT